jgi:hypothetical protein
MKLMASVVFVSTAVTLIAADATGTWTGTFVPTGPEAGAVHLILKQEGTKLTGTVGPRAEDQHEIQNGKAIDGKLTFDVVVKDATMKFMLHQEATTSEARSCGRPMAGFKPQN